jgi:hypothetical protein
MIMQRLIKYIFPTVLAGLLSSLQAFTLMGPLEDWQVPEIGYGLVIASTDGGAPKNLGEEYRHSSPVVTYGYDASWLDYFGPRGIAAVDSSFAVFNALSPVSTWSDTLQEFPLTTYRVNHTARNMRLLDVKSLVMSMILEQMGLGPPERYTFTLRSRNVIDDVDFYTVIRRNFDPVTYLPTPFVNGTLYTYRTRPILFRGDVAGYDAQELAVDVSDPNITVAAGYAIGAGLIDPRVQERIGIAGSFYTGLTRDDAGGIRYLLSPFNRNFELSPPGAGPRTTNGIIISGGSTGGGFGGGSSPWTPVGGIVVGDATGETDIEGGGVIGQGFIQASVRAGVDKVNFVRVDMDPLLGTFARPFIIRYTERVQALGVTRSQDVERVLTRPDILFGANDVGVTDLGTPITYSRSIDYINNSEISGIIGETSGGPGNMGVTSNVIFNRVGPYTRHTRFTTEETGIDGFMWGSFDGTTNAPVVYPAGRVDLRELERILTGR